MARDWKTTYVASAASASHTATFPQAAVAGHGLVAIAVAPATVAPPVDWTEHADPLGAGELSGASKVAAGGEASIVWGRDAGQSTAARTLAGWVESRDDIGDLHGTAQAVNNPASSPEGVISLAPIVTTVDNCRIYVAVSTVNPTQAWAPVWTGGVTAEDVVDGPALGFESVRLAVASGVVPAGSHNITVGGVPGSNRQIVVFALAPADTGTPPPAAETAIEAENRLAGTPKSVWDVTGAGDASIQGFATAMSVARGSTLELKVHSPSASWTGKVYRLGWYGSLGAREVATVSGAQTTQPSGTTDPTTGMVSCANWTANGSWAVPADATPGVYVIKVQRSDNAALNSHIGPFVVTDPARKAAIAVKLSDSTWQAYNYAGANPADPFAGKNLYGVGTASGFTFDAAQRCKAVSYDRPLVTRKGIPQTHFFNAEYPLVRWIERLGYDVDYLTCAQVDADPSLLLGRDVVISSGHDEYWSAAMRDAFVAARDDTTAPSHLLFLSGNEAFWRIRWDSGRRTFACWKDSLDGQLNPTGLYSGTWQDTRSFNSDRRPAALLNGQRFRLNGIAAYAMGATSAHASSPLWRNTPVAALTGSQTWTSPVGIVGFEADEPADLDPAETPPGLVRLSQVTHQVTGLLADDNGATYTGSGPYTHAITAYRDPESGAAVFAAGTVQYAWGLDDTHDRHPGGSLVSVPLQQALTNLLADLGALPPAYPFPAGLEMPTPVALSTYGLPDPAGPEEPTDLVPGSATARVTSGSTDVGDVIEVTLAAVAGATVTAAVTAPGAPAATVTPVVETPAESGLYPHRFLLSAPGMWQVKFTATGTVTASETFHVFAEAGSPPLATAAQVVKVFRPVSPAEEQVITARLAQASRMLRDRFPDLDARIAAGTLDPATAADAAVGMVLRLVRVPGGLRSETTGPFRRDYIVDGEAATAQLTVTQAEMDLLAVRTSGPRKRAGTIRVQAGLAPGVPPTTYGERRVRIW